MLPDAAVSARRRTTEKRMPPLPPPWGGEIVSGMSFSFQTIATENMTQRLLCKLRTVGKQTVDNGINISISINAAAHLRANKWMKCLSNVLCGLLTMAVCIYCCRENSK